MVHPHKKKIFKKNRGIFEGRSSTINDQRWTFKKMIFLIFIFLFPVLFIQSLVSCWHSAFLPNVYQQLGPN